MKFRIYHTDSDFLFCKLSFLTHKQFFNQNFAQKPLTFFLLKHPNFLRMFRIIFRIMCVEANLAEPKHGHHRNRHKSKVENCITKHTENP